MAKKKELRVIRYDEMVFEDEEAVLYLNGDEVERIDAAGCVEDWMAANKGIEYKQVVEDEDNENGEEEDGNGEE